MTLERDTEEAARAAARERANELIEQNQQQVLEDAKASAVRKAEALVETRFGKNDSRWIAGGSFFVAALALGFTIWHGIATTAHNKLSVAPRLVVHALVSPDSPITRDARGPGIYLHNVGLGPAIVTALRVYVDDELVAPTADQRNPWQLVAARLGRRDGLSSFVIIPGHTLRAGQYLNVFLPVTGNEDAEDWFAQQVRRISVEIDFESLYGDASSYRWAAQ